MPTGLLYANNDRQWISKESRALEIEGERRKKGTGKQTCLQSAGYMFTGVVYGYYGQIYSALFAKFGLICWSFFFASLLCSLWWSVLSSERAHRLQNFSQTQHSRHNFHLQLKLQRTHIERASSARNDFIARIICFWVFSRIWVFTQSFWI